MLAPWKESYDKHSVLKKQRHHFFDQGVVFPVVMYGCESWTKKKTERLSNCGAGKDS